MTNINRPRTESGKTDSTTQRDGVTTGYAEVHGARLYYEMAGTGEPLIFLHAGIADHHMWDTQFYAFAEAYQVMRYDMRGYGSSTLGEGNFSHAQDLYILLRSLDIPAATLIGSSLGGTTAMDFALEQPAMANALVLVSAVPSGYDFTGEAPSTLQKFMAACQKSDLPQAAELATQLWFDGPQRRPEAVDPDLRSQVRSMVQEVLSSGAVNLSGANAAAQPALARLSEIVAPTLVIVGAQDDESILQAGDLIVDRIAGADRVEIDGAAHLPNLEKPDEFYRAVVDFLQRIADIDREGRLATGLGGAVKRKEVEPEPLDR